MIQEAYRNYRMRLNFKKIKVSKSRRLTLDNFQDVKQEHNKITANKDNDNNKDNNDNKDTNDIICNNTDDSLHNNSTLTVENTASSEDSVESCGVPNDSNSEQPSESNHNIPTVEEPVSQQQPPTDEQLVSAILADIPFRDRASLRSRRKRHGHGYVTWTLDLHYM